MHAAGVRAHARRTTAGARKLGAVRLDPDIGDAALRARLRSTVPETQLREDQSDLANWDAGRPPGDA